MAKAYGTRGLIGQTSPLSQVKEIEGKSVKINELKRKAEMKAKVVSVVHSIHLVYGKDEHECRA